MKGYTLKFRPWIVVLVAPFKTKVEAMKRETFLKSGHGRAWVRNEILSPYK